MPENVRNEILIAPGLQGSFSPYHRGAKRKTMKKKQCSGGKRVEKRVSHIQKEGSPGFGVLKRVSNFPCTGRQSGKYRQRGDNRGAAIEAVTAALITKHVASRTSHSSALTKAGRGSVSTGWQVASRIPFLASRKLSFTVCTTFTAFFIFTKIRHLLVG